MSVILGMSFRYFGYTLHDIWVCKFYSGIQLFILVYNFYFGIYASFILVYNFYFGMQLLFGCIYNFYLGMQLLFWYATFIWVYILWRVISAKIRVLFYYYNIFVNGHIFDLTLMHEG